MMRGIELRAFENVFWQLGYRILSAESERDIYSMSDTWTIRCWPRDEPEGPMDLWYLELNIELLICQLLGDHRPNRLTVVIEMERLARVVMEL